MTPENLKQHLDREPFVPIRIHLASGAVIEVARPGDAHTLRHTLMVFRKPRADRAVEEYTEINYRLIERIDLVPHEASA